MWVAEVSLEGCQDHDMTQGQKIQLCKNGMQRQFTCIIVESRLTIMACCTWHLVNKLSLHPSVVRGVPLVSVWYLVQDGWWGIIGRRRRRAGLQLANLSAKQFTNWSPYRHLASGALPIRKKLSPSLSAPPLHSSQPRKELQKALEFIKKALLLCRGRLCPCVADSGLCLHNPTRLFLPTCRLFVRHIPAIHSTHM